MTQTQIEPLIEESIDVAAPPATVWKLVTDLPRMAKLEPQVVRTIVRGGRSRSTRTLNINRRGPGVADPVQGGALRATPEFAFRVKDNYTIWSFTLEPTETGTRVMQRREAPRAPPRSPHPDPSGVGGQESFQRSLPHGMRQTLRRLKADAEA